MKLKTNELEVGDFFYFRYERYNKEFPCEVVDTPIVYDAHTLKPVKVVIIDYWVDEKRHEQIKLTDGETWEVLYRRNNDYMTVEGEIMNK